MKKWIKIPIFYTIIKGKKVIDEEAINEEFDFQFRDIRERWKLKEAK